MLEYYERKLLLAGSCWRLMLECYERKILLADAGAKQQNRVNEMGSFSKIVPDVLCLTTVSYKNNILSNKKLQKQ